ncbi:MAG: CsgG/HfaB family protein [Elusimicrobiota bacterium]|jgi:curli biogenesis system outer membrane secretion channel CsgG|nr:CsgG/HfaB family protein [Elusimicrobiota bacterium]
MKKILTLTALLFCFGCAPKTYISRSYDFNKIQRIGVLGFSSPYEAFSGAENLFSQYLLSYGYTVVERAQIERVLGEHEFSASSYLSPDITRKIGKVLGVDALLLGEVTSYLPEQKTLAYNVSRTTSSEPVYHTEIIAGPDGEPIVNTYYAGQQQRLENNVYPSEYMIYAQVGVVAKLVDVNTAEIIWVGSDTTEGVSGLDALSSSAKGLVKSFDKEVRKARKAK